MLRKIRTILAAVTLVLITLLFLDFTGTLHSWLGWMAKIQLLPAVMALNVVVIVALIALTLVFGRIYCSVICPLGVFQDVLARLRRKKNKYGYSPEVKWLRYPVLAVFVLAWRGGRTYCNTICPVGTVLSLLARFSWLKVRFDEDKCRNCSLCSKNCKAACIDYKTHTVDYSRCVVCGNCIDSCKFGALKYSKDTFVSKESRNQGNSTQGADQENPEILNSLDKKSSVDTSRRSFLLATALASTAAMAQKKEKLMDGGYAEIVDKVAPERQTPLTPPGSLSASNLATRCTGCQLCVSECPNHVLRPSTDLMHLMQPTMSYEKGYCRPECTRCSDVCPAGAIKPLDDVEKSSIQIGHAVWIRKNCIPLVDEVACGNCARHCPAGAITMVPSDPDDEQSLKIPAINENACIGCGACEYVCPARPFSAIYVEGHEVHKMI